MSDEDALHRLITKFMLSTCCSTINENRAFLRKSIDDFLNAFANCLLGDGETIISGSTAELYVRPILLCYGDIDIMHSFKCELATPYGKLPHVELWDCHQDTVTVYEIIDSHKPGYVYLQQSYVVKKDENGRYVVQTLRNNIMRTSLLCSSSNIIQRLFGKDSIQRWGNEEICNNLSAQVLHYLITDVDSKGPAESIRYRNFNNFRCNYDYVLSVFCPVWPPQAGDWPIRNRHHGWPDQPTINMVVSSACHVVGAVHPSCRDDQKESKYQWRLSFSRAEVTLLNSWTRVQQIVYHILRLALKREVLSKINWKGT